MVKNKLNNLLILLGLGLIALLSCICYSMSSNDYIPVLFVILFDVIGACLFCYNIYLRRSSFLFYIYFSSFFINVTFSIIFFYNFMYFFNSPFVPGGDAEGFYNFSLNIVNGWLGYGVPIVQESFLGYVYTLAGVNYFFYLFLHNYSVLIPSLFNACVGAFLPVGLSLLSKQIIDDSKFARAIALFAMVFPLFIYFSSTGWRDVVISVAVLYFVYFQILAIKSKRLSSRSFYYLCMVICAVIIFYYRSLSSLILASALIVYITNVFGSLNIKKIIAIMILIILGALFYDKLEFLINLAFQYKQNWVIYSLAGSSSGSIGLFITNLPFPLNEIIKTMLFFLGIFPPFVINHGFYDFQSYFNGIGLTIWYLLIYFWIIFLYKGKMQFKKLLITYIFVFAIITSFGGGGVGDLRHLTQILPFLFLQGFYTFYCSKEKTKAIFFYILFLLSLLMIYVFIKMFLFS